MTEAEKIYSRLHPTKTESGYVIIKNVFGKHGVEYAKSISAIFSLRIQDTKFHFGNPYSSFFSSPGIIKTSSTKESVIKYIEWVLESDDSRAIWIREMIQSHILRNKPIIYCKELGEPSHANALDYLINNL